MQCQPNANSWGPANVLRVRRAVGLDNAEINKYGLIGIIEHFANILFLILILVFVKQLPVAARPHAAHCANVLRNNTHSDWGRVTMRYSDTHSISSECVWLLAIWELFHFHFAPFSRTWPLFLNGRCASFGCCCRCYLCVKSPAPISVCVVYISLSLSIYIRRVHSSITYTCGAVLRVKVLSISLDSFVLFDHTIATPSFCLYFHLNQKCSEANGIIHNKNAIHYRDWRFEQSIENEHSTQF